MPTLRSYTQSSPKSGFYIQANVGGSHPITLQVTGIAEAILRRTGYEPDQAVPTKLVWAMYDLELLYTNQSVDPDAADDVSIDDVFNGLDLGNRLSAGEKRKLLSFIEDYQGPKGDTLAGLRAELEGSSTSSVAGSLNATTSRWNDVSRTVSEAVSELYMLCSSAEVFRKHKQDIDKDYLLRSLRTFIPHPHVDHAETAVNYSNTLRYRLRPPESFGTFQLTDCRGQDFPNGYEEADYVLRVSQAGADTRAILADGSLVDLQESSPGESSSQNVFDDLEWILPPSPVPMDEPLPDEVTEYAGLALEPIRPPEDPSGDQLRLVTVDRISQNGNPVIEIDGNPDLLDDGEPGERYLAEHVER